MLLTVKVKILKVWGRESIVRSGRHKADAQICQTRRSNRKSEHDQTAGVPAVVAVVAVVAALVLAATAVGTAVDGTGRVAVT